MTRIVNKLNKKITIMSRCQREMRRHDYDHVHVGCAAVLADVPIHDAIDVRICHPSPLVL